ncbi:MAG: hypothetical protein RDV48_02135 [Candidatus Eremiobacteraeota bacterium]|nr:hypothetical protein [Candidatus Eremiobacteraeota bacterium]
MTGVKLGRAEGMTSLGAGGGISFPRGGEAMTHGEKREACDGGELSEEALEDREERGGGNFGLLLRNILLDTRGEVIPEQDDILELPPAVRGSAIGPEASERRGNGPGKQEVEEVSVEWRPLVSVHELVERGRSWGRFHVSRERRYLEGSVGDEPGPGKSRAVLKSAGDSPCGGNPGESGHGAFTTLDEGGHVFVYDTESGEKREIHDDEELQATHPLAVSTIGREGALEAGEELMNFKCLSPEEVRYYKMLKERELGGCSPGGAAGEAGCSSSEYRKELDVELISAQWLPREEEGSSVKAGRPLGICSAGREKKILEVLPQDGIEKLESLPLGADGKRPSLAHDGGSQRAFSPAGERGVLSICQQGAKLVVMDGQSGDTEELSSQQEVTAKRPFMVISAEKPGFLPPPGKVISGE